MMLIGADNGPSDPAGRPGGEPATRTGAKQPRIMIVEDEYIISLDIEEAVIEAGMAVVGNAKDTASAIALAEAQRPDFVTLDLRLAGGESGWDVGRALTDRFDIPALVVSAFVGSTTPQMEGVRLLGAISKPFQQDDLVGALRTAARRLSDP